jgi:cytochrome c oxidase subunit 2
MNSTRPTTFNTRTVIVLIIVGLFLIGGGFLMSTAVPLVFPAQASAESQQVDNLFAILLIIGGAIFLLVQGLLAYSVWRFRARPGDNSDGIYLHGNTTLEIVWTAVPAVIVFLLTILSYQVFNSIQAPKDNELSVRVDGRRFNWAFSYETDTPSPTDPTQNIVITSTDLHTFVGQPMALVMQPQDVIHSFWVPAFRVKQDLIPGRETTVRFTPVEVPGTEYPAVYPVRCAELCGAGHGEMVTDVVVYQDEAAFQAWLDAEIEKVLNPPADPVERGYLILATGPYPCYTCHVLDIENPDNPWVGTTGPSLNGIGDRAVGIRSQATGLSGADYVYQSIHEPTAYLVPGYGPLMPQLNVPECDLQAMVAYLGTKTESGTPAYEIDRDAFEAQCGGAAPSAETTAEATDEAGETDTSAEATAEVTVEATSDPVATWTPSPETEGTAEATP